MYIHRVGLHRNAYMDVTAWLAGRTLKDTVLILLNQPIKNSLVFAKAWHSCAYRIVSDGAANRLHAIPHSDEYVPDLIAGDFDSIKPDVRFHYERLGVEFATDKSVYATDFMKSMRFGLERRPETTTYLAFGTIGGRVDHSWHSYLCLGRAAKEGKILILVSDENITMLVPEGEHTIMTPLSVVGEACGFIPFCDAARVSTKGFEWDVTDWECSFDTQISTSNHLTGDHVWFKTDRPLVFTMELRPPFKGTD